MQKPTINQINGRTQNNSTIQFYKSLCTDESRYNREQWRHNYFNYTYNGQIRNISPAGNFIYCAASQEFNRIIKEDTGQYYDYHRDHRTEYIEIEFNPYVLQFKISIQQDMNGVYLCLETNFKPMEDRWNNYTPYVSRYSHRIRSNSEFKNLDIKQYFERFILPKYLFAPGIFRNIQIVKNCNKKEAIKYYKEVLKKVKDTEIYSYKAICRHIKRKLNVQICDDFSEKYLFNLLAEGKRYKTVKKLHKHPSIFELSDQYCSEFDTDGHEEEFLNGIYSDYSDNAIFA